MNGKEPHYYNKNLHNLNLKLEQKFKSLWNVLDKNTV